MRKFSFSLESVLRIRMHEERQVELRLAEVTGQCVLLRRSLSELREEKAGSYRRISAELAADIRFRLQHDTFVAGVDARLRRLTGELTNKEKELAEVQEEFRIVRARRKALDELKSRRQEEHYAGEKRNEAKALDEIGGTLYVRNRGTSIVSPR